MDAATRTVGLTRLLDGLSDGVGVVRLDGDDLVFVEANDVLAEAIGRPPDELAGRRLRTLQPERIVTPGIGLAREVLEQDRPLRRELDVEGPAGRQVVRITMLPLSGAENEILMIVRDLTRVRDVAAALRETQAIARIGHWAWDMEADRITWTDELYRIFGVDPETWPATYESYRERLHPDDRADVETTIQEAIREARTYTMQHRVVRPDGAVRVVSSLGDVVTDRSGEPVRLAGTAQDITERIEAEQEAVRLREAYARQQQGLELNDNVMQGLAVARLAIMEGDVDQALASLDRTMEAAREIIRSLLEARADGGSDLRPGELVRSRGALQRNDV